MTVKEFTISREFLTSCEVREEYARFGSRRDLTGDELLELLKLGPITGYSTSHEDHPEFTKLREELGSLGLINIHPRVSNGDVCVKAFKLNGLLFNVGDKFPCAAAMDYTIYKNHLRRHINDKD